MTPTIPAGRLQLTDVAPRQYGAMYRFSSSVELDHGLRALIEIRASQINGCAFCLDMHWKDAVAAGETDERLYMLSAWRESPLYSERERAALELCEAMTEIAGSWCSRRRLGAGRGRVRRRGARSGGVRGHGHQRLEPACRSPRGWSRATTTPGCSTRPRASAMDGRRPMAGRDCERSGSRPRPASPERTVAEFDRLRPYLLRVAYSHLGSLSEAEDLVQEAWLRLARADRAEIRDLRAWLTTVISRLAIDALTSARARRERYVGPWLPEPLVESARGELGSGAPHRPRRGREHGDAHRARVAVARGAQRIPAARRVRLLVRGGRPHR